MAGKAEEAVGDIPVRRQVCWPKVERQEIHEIQVTRESLEDAKIKDKDNWSCRRVKREVRYEKWEDLLKKGHMLMKSCSPR